MEIINTGGLKRIDYERDEQTAISDLFREIYGVGKHAIRLSGMKLISCRSSAGSEMV